MLIVNAILNQVLVSFGVVCAYVSIVFLHDFLSFCIVYGCDYVQLGMVWGGLIIAHRPRHGSYRVI